MLALELLAAYRIPLLASEAWRPLVRWAAGLLGCGDAAAADEAREARGAAAKATNAEEEPDSDSSQLTCVTRCTNLPWRGALYLLVGIPLLTKGATAIAGVAVVAAGAVYTTAVLRGEIGDGRSTKRTLHSRRGGSWSAYVGCDCCCCLPGEEAAASEEAGVDPTCYDRL